MELILSKKIDDKIFTQVEYLHHTRQGLLFIVNEIIKKRSEYEYNKELLDYYVEKYQNIDLKFRVLSEEIIKDIDSEYLKDIYYSQFNLIDKLVEIYKKENKHESNRLGTISRFCCKNNEQ